MKNHSWELNIGTFMSLFGAGIGFVAVVIVFAFSNFQTKAEAKIESDQVKQKQSEVDENVHELRADIKDLRNEVNQKLNVLIEMQKHK